jgi:hypothetical protein
MAATGKDCFPSQSCIVVDLAPGHLRKLGEGDEHSSLIVLLQLEQALLEDRIVEIES